MAAHDPDAVQILAAAYHAIECLPGSKPNARWSGSHQRLIDNRKGAEWAERIRNAGWHLTTTKEN